MSGEDSVSVRRAELSDIHELCRLFFQGAKFHEEHAPSFFQVPSEPWAIEFFQGHFKNPNVTVFLAEIGNSIVGQARCEIRNSPNIELLRPNTTLQIEEVVVDESHRRRGVAKKLISAIEE